MSTRAEGVESKLARALSARWLMSTAIVFLVLVSGSFPARADDQARPSAKGSAQSAAAQVGPTPTPAQAPQAPVQEVIVTGSRIARRDYESQSPIVTVNAAAFQNNSSVAIETTLNELPQFTTAANQSSLSTANNPFPSATATPGASLLDLRGLGPNRTLVLIDGQRAQPINATLAVDVNTIPAAAIDSVETITGGAAATYGADAIAGVVNFKLKKNFQGLQLDAQYGESQYGDDQETQLSALMGNNFADGKGNIMLALSYARRGGVDGAERPWVQAGWNDPGTLAGGLLLPSYYAGGDLPNVPSAAVGGWINGASNYYIDQNGHVFNANDPLDPAHPYTGPIGGGSGFKINPNGSLGYNSPNDPLQIPLTRWSAFGRGHFALNDHISVFAQLNFTETRTFYESGTPSSLETIWSPKIPYDPACDDPSSPTFGQACATAAGTTFQPVPAQLATLLNSRPTPNAPWSYNSGLDYIGGFTELNTSHVYQLTAGLDGDVPGTDWSWEVYGSHGFTDVVQQQPNGYPQLQRLQDLFSANMYGQGFTNTFYPVAVTGACTSGIPVFNANGSVNLSTTISQNCADWILLRMNTITQLTQDIAEGDIQGGIIDIPWGAGRLKYALGVDYRSEDFSFNPDSGYNANQETPQVVNNIALPVAVNGETDVSEAYTEFSIPVIKNLPGIKSFEIDPGYRYSDYNTAGGVSTFKVLGDWGVTSWIKFRGGLEVANRAPNISELFTPIGGSNLVVGADPCAVYPQTPSWGNTPSNPNRLNVQALCQYLITRDGGPASIMVPGGSANNYMYDFGGYSPNAFPYALGLSQGNPNLKSEVAHTLTAGTVIHMPFDAPLISQMTLSVDWYHILLTGAIAEPAFTTVYQECLDPQYNPTVGAAYGTYTGAQMAAANPYCALINREYAPAAGDYYGAVRNYNAQYINEGAIKTAGIDAEYDWTFHLSDLISAAPGSLSVNVLWSYLNEFAISPFTGAAYINYTGTTYSDGNSSSYFRYKLFTTMTYHIGPVSAGLRWEHYPGLVAPQGSSPGTLGANPYDLIDFFSTWAVTDSINLRFGIDNLVNAWPVWVGAQPGTNNAVGTTNYNYDTIGRRFYLGATAKF